MARALQQRRLEPWRPGRADRFDKFKLVAWRGVRTWGRGSCPLWRVADVSASRTPSHRSAQILCYKNPTRRRSVLVAERSTRRSRRDRSGTARHDVRRGGRRCQGVTTGASASTTTSPRAFSRTAGGRGERTTQILRSATSAPRERISNPSWLGTWKSPAVAVMQAGSAPLHLWETDTMGNWVVDARCADSAARASDPGSCAVTRAVFDTRNPGAHDATDLMEGSQSLCRDQMMHNTNHLRVDKSCPFYGCDCSNAVPFCTM